MKQTQPSVAGDRSDDARVTWVDMAKGLCIIFVAATHATLGVEEAVGAQGFMHHVVTFTRPFRMPEFFLVSGLFMSRVIDRDWRTYGDRRIVYFVYFYLLWLLIHSTVKFNLVSGGTLAGFLEHLAFSLIEPFSILWFVYILAVFSAVTKLLRPVYPPVLLAAAAVLEIAPIETSWNILNEFCNRYVYFVTGYILAPYVFRLAAWAGAHRGPVILILAAWASVNAWLTMTASGLRGFPTWASLPFVSLPLGMAGALATVFTAVLLVRTVLAEPLRYAGGQALTIYLAFVFPMAATRILLIQTGLVEDVGIMSLIVTAMAVIVPLMIERLVRDTPAAFLFRRPAAFTIDKPKRLKVQTA